MLCVQRDADSHSTRINAVIQEALDASVRVS
jgi:hypothetical protein